LAPFTLLKNQFQPREVVVDAVLDRESCEWRHEGRYTLKLDLGVKMQDGFFVLGSEVVAVEKRGRSAGGADRELARLLAGDDLESVGRGTGR